MSYSLLRVQRRKEYLANMAQKMGWGKKILQRSFLEYTSFQFQLKQSYASTYHFGDNQQNRQIFTSLT